MPGCPFIGLEGVVLYNGGGGGRFGRGSIRAVGSDERNGCSSHFESGRERGIGRRHARAHVRRRWRRRSLGLGRKTTGGAHVSTKEGGAADWAGERSRPSG
jgi:hypothetical protein